MTSIYDYFMLKLFEAPGDETLLELTITSPCGIDCMKIIDAAAAFRNAVAEVDPDLEDETIKIAEEAVAIAWRG